MSPHVLLAVLLLLATTTEAFERPSEYERRRALGNLHELPEAMRPLFTPDDDFHPIPRPGRNDWLTWHREPGQTFDEYRDSGANRPDAERRFIYLLPLGGFDSDTAPDLAQIRDYVAAFYQMPVRLLPAYDPHDLEFKPRRNPRSEGQQWLTTEILGFLKTKLPVDAYCLLGVTMTDLYPEPSWNFVFGQASLEERVGVFSYARYDPAFWGDERGERYRDVILQRGSKVLVHETAHMFGLWHCIHFECVVNGSNHMAETDRAPQHLCPICLRKLHHATGFDPVRRYRDLAGFYRRQKWYDELDFVNRQLARLSPADAPAAPTVAPR